MIESVICGFQTGADIAGADFAIQNNIPHFGYCPRGRRYELGTIPPQYNCKETVSREYPYRTAANILSAPATLIFTFDSKLTHGCLLTAKLAKKAKRPYFHMHKGISNEALLMFMDHWGFVKINVAGSCESKENGIYSWTLQTLNQLHSQMKSGPSANAN